MDLEEFVQTTLTQIIGGVQKARAASPEAKGCFASDATPYPVSSAAGYWRDNMGETVYMIEFDVAVTAESSSEAGGKLGLKVAMLGEIKGGGSSTNQDTVMSRVKFQVPITYPAP